MGLQFSEFSLFEVFILHLTQNNFPSLTNYFMITLAEPLQSGKLPHNEDSFHPKSYGKARSRNSSWL